MLINPIKLISTAAFSSSLLERREINFLRLTHWFFPLNGIAQRDTNLFKNRFTI
jgi:hypothetical protein